jgi:uncharacterized membrane protein
VAFGLNMLGHIVGSFTDASGNGHGFLDQGGVFTQVNFPGAASTDANGTNVEGFIVGDYFDGSGVEHGYFAAVTSLDQFWRNQSRIWRNRSTFYPSTCGTV